MGCVLETRTFLSGLLWGNASLVIVGVEGRGVEEVEGAATEVCVLAIWLMVRMGGY
jgi:hypothetical protein